MAMLGSLATLAGLAVWLAAPALSSRPYVPRPIDFELRDHPLTDRTAAAATLRSRLARSSRVHALRSKVIDAPKRFNLVGLRWHGARSAILYLRVRREGGRWSGWKQVGVDSDDGPDIGTSEETRARRRGGMQGGGRARANRGRVVSDPIWAGEADYVQYRIAASGSPSDVRLHFVNTKGTASKSDRLRTGLRRTVAAVLGKVASLTGASAGADSTLPPIVTRDQWDASSCPPRAQPAYGEVKMAFIHHTVSANDYGPADSAAMVRAICRYHRNSNGWNDIGYQFLVDKYGTIFEGRAGGIDQAVVGAQAQGYNTQSTGISSLGTFSTTGQSEAGLGALARLLSWKLALHGVAPQSKVFLRSSGGSTNRFRVGQTVQLNAISGHRDGDATSCPGDGLYAQLPRLRSMVSPDLRPGSLLGLSAARQRILYGRKARLAGSLKLAGGPGLDAREIRIRALASNGQPRTVAKLRTGATGGFAFNLRLAFNRTVLADFRGDGAARPTASAAFRIGVRPRVTASLDATAGATLKAGGRVRVSGLVRPRKRTALLLVDRKLSTGGFRRVLKRPVPVRQGRVRVSYKPRKPGGYRVRLGVDADGRNLSARSDPIALTVR